MWVVHLSLEAEVHRAAGHETHGVVEAGLGEMTHCGPLVLIRVVQEHLVTTCRASGVIIMMVQYTAGDEGAAAFQDLKRDRWQKNPDRGRGTRTGKYRENAVNGQKKLEKTDTPVHRAALPKV